MNQLFRKWLMQLAYLAGFIALGGCSSEMASDADDEGASSTSQALCKGVQLTTSTSAPIQTSVTLSASNVTCAPSEQPEYLFRYQRSGTTPWVTIRSWSATATTTWDVSGLPSGPYLVQVLSRAQGSSATAETNKKLQVLVGEVCSAVALSPSVSSPQPLGTVVDLTATGHCSAGLPEYRFELVSPSGTVSLLRDFDATATLRWDTTQLAAGIYTLRVLARRIGNVVPESLANLAFRLGESCSRPQVLLLFSETSVVCGQRADQTLLCWGGETSRTWEQPPAVPFLDVVVSSTGGCGIRPDNTVECWGDDILGETTPPSGTFSQLDGGMYYLTCGVRTNGAVACWGYNNEGQADAPSGTFSSVTVGFEHVCGIHVDGSVACWGRSDVGQATPPAGTFKALALGVDFSCGLRPDGTEACWGKVWR